MAGDGSPRADEGQDDGPTGEDDAPADDSEGPAAVEPPGPDGDVPAASVPTVGDEAEVPVPVDADAVVQAEADEEPIEESEAAGSAK